MFSLHKGTIFEGLKLSLFWQISSRGQSRVSFCHRLVCYNNGLVCADDRVTCPGLYRGVPSSSHRVVLTFVALHVDMTFPKRVVLST